MTKANLQIDFGNLGADEFANALALVAAALRGAVVPRNSVTGAIEITEGPDAVQPTATLGSPDAFWSAAFIDSLNIGGREITADTLLPVTPLVFTRPVDATEDQTPSIIWPWPHSQETAARITIVSPQVGGHGGTGGGWLGGSVVESGQYTDLGSDANNPNEQGQFYSFQFNVYGLSFGDQFLFSFGRGGPGGAGGAPDFTSYGANQLGAGAQGESWQAPVGWTAIRVPASLNRWRVAGLNYSSENPRSLSDLATRFKGGHAHYENGVAPNQIPAGWGMSGTPSGQSPWRSEANIRVPNISGRYGASGLRFSTANPITPTAGSPGEPGHNGFIIIEPFRGTT